MFGLILRFRDLPDRARNRLHARFADLAVHSRPLGRGAAHRVLRELDRVRARSPRVRQRLDASDRDGARIRAGALRYDRERQENGRGRAAVREQRHGPPRSFADAVARRVPRRERAADGTFRRTLAAAARHAALGAWRRRRDADRRTAPQRGSAARRLIVTADDFGSSLAVNEAVERGHREGILTSASLMVAGEAAGDAIARARALPSLAVGLHVVVVNGTPVLPPRKVPALVDARGAFSDDLVGAGVRYFFDPAARRQLAAEIRAQFEAFAASGLRLDHANAHNHMHVHPTVLSTIIAVGKDFGLPGVRLPREPYLRSWQSA
ncbi:MAG: hopanoid biosynthesis-associated protein HpnK, partial [Candidatus Eremiobacteraeota bacterium]|nr:hopanoid biosynthesis-associated protein HpnK [Candidatus Eremiobacteraeota bacterium]